MARMMSLEEVANRLGVSYTTAYRLVIRGELPGVKVGRQWRVEPTDLEAFIKRSRSQDREGSATDLEV